MKGFWDSNSKFTTPSTKLRPCILWTVHVHDNVKGDCVLLTDSCCLFYEEQTKSHISLLLPNYVVELPHLTALPLTCHVIIKFQYTTLTELFKYLNSVTLPTKPFTNLPSMSTFTVHITCEQFNWLLFSLIFLINNINLTLWYSNIF